MPRPLSASRRRLAAWYFWYFAFVGAFSPYFTLYLKSLGLSAAAIGALMSLMLAMRLLAPNLWGWLADYSGHNTRIVRVSALLSLAGFSGFFFATDFWALFVAMAFMAFFWSASLPLVEALTLRCLEGITEQYGRIRLWGSVGFIAAVLLTGAWLDRAPLATLLWINVGLLLGIVGCAMLLPEARIEPASETSGPLLRLVLRTEVMALLGACFFMSAAHGPFYVFYSIHLVAHGYDKAGVGALWSIGVLAEIGVFICMPRLLRSFSSRTILTASFAMAVVRFLLIGWGADFLSMMVVAQILHGATFGACHAAAVAALNEWFPTQQQARAQALYGSVSFGAGGMLGNLASGAAWESIGPEATFTVGAAFAAFGLILAWFGTPRRLLRGS
jgi:MFS transporter, PPP family, 3-phenylpropionic acid transporter